MNSTENYPLPAGMGDIIGTIAHMGVGIAGILWGLRCILKNDAFEHGTKAEKVTYLVSAFWEVVGTIPLMTIPELCYHSLACYQRNVTHVLAGSCMFLGVIWDILLRRLRVPSRNNWGIAVISSISPAYFLYFHDHDKVEMGEDSELIVHQNAMLMFALMGILRFLIPLLPSVAVTLRSVYAFTSMSLGSLMFLAGPGIRETLVSVGFSGTNISFGAFFAASCFFLVGMIIRENAPLRQGYENLPVEMVHLPGSVGLV